MKILLLLICSFSFLPAFTQGHFSLTFNHQALSVKDVDKAAAFYADVMKLKEIPTAGGMQGIRWFSLGEGKELHLLSTITEPVQVNKAVHLALNTPDFENFILHLQRMKILYMNWAGQPHTINVRADGIRQVFFQDVDGYWIEVNSTAAQ